MPCPGAVPHVHENPEPSTGLMQPLPTGGSGQPRVMAWPPATRSPLTLVEEDIVCVEGDTGEDIVGGAGVALVHPLDLHVQPAGRAEPC